MSTFDETAMMDVGQDDSFGRLRIPPHSIEAEQSVLGGLLLDNEAWDRAGDVLVEADFYRHEHRMIFGVLGGLINACKVADIITVFEQLRSLGKDAETGGLVYLNALVQSVPSANNIRRYAEIVREKRLLRDLVAASDEVASQAFNPQGREGQELADKAATRFTDLQRQSLRRVPRSAGDLLPALLDGINARHEGEEGTKAWSTGLQNVDDALNGGLRPGKVYVIAARPSVGKSSLAQAILLACAGQGHTSAMLSQEMEASECMDRALANLAGVDYEAIQTGRIDDMQWGQLSSGAELLGRMPFFIDDEGGLTLSAIRAKAVALRREGLKVLCVDYLQLCDYQAQRGQSTNDAVGMVSKGIKKLAKDLGIAILLLSQLNREVEKRLFPEPGLSDLRDSGAIEQDADVVLMLWQRRQWSDRRIMGLTFAKNRAGKFKGRIPLEFFGEFQRWGTCDVDISPDKAGKGAPQGDFE